MHVDNDNDNHAHSFVTILAYIILTISILTIFSLYFFTSEKSYDEVPNHVKE